MPRTKNGVVSCAMSILLSDFLYWLAIQIWPNLIDTARKDHRTMVDVEHTSQVSVMSTKWHRKNGRLAHRLAYVNISEESFGGDMGVI